MNIYILKNGESENALLPFLSEQRQKNAKDIKNPAVRREKIYSYALFRYSVFREHSVTSAPIFSYGERGKPFLPEYPRIHFSISHAGGFSACVLSDSEIGLDIQDFRPLKADISAKICTKNELERLSECDNRDYELCRLWCMKESRGKLTGKGFAEGFGKIETSDLLSSGRLYNTVTENGLFVSACAFSPLPEINIKRIDEEKLIKALAAIE